MSTLVQRFCLRAVPLPHNKQYRPYETASIVVFVREEHRSAGLEKLALVLARQRWQLLALEVHDKLVEERVRSEGGDVWAAFEHALKYGDCFRIFPDHFAAGRKRGYATTAPRIARRRRAGSRAVLSRVENVTPIARPNTCPLRFPLSMQNRGDQF
jgi:hypothetical protein